MNQRCFDIQLPYDSFRLRESRTVTWVLNGLRVKLMCVPLYPMRAESRKGFFQQGRAAVSYTVR